MNKTQYRTARRLVRQNGKYALRWMTGAVFNTMDYLYNGQSKDRLAERADIVSYCNRAGIPCNPRQTA